MSVSPLRIGILGAANIARQFTAAVAGSDRVTITAVASRGSEKALAFARDLDVPEAFGSYEELLAAPHIDAVYIPLPNHLHAEWAIRSLAAGKHVLSEKPLAVSAAEVQRMFDAARQHGRLLCEGYPWLAQPQTRQLRNLIDAGDIGSVVQVAVHFSAPFSDVSNIRLRADAGGGALLDLGSYCVSFLRFVTGRRPIKVTAQADHTSSGVDRGTVATLSYSDGVTATLNCSFAAAYHRSALVHGATGSLVTSFRNHAPGAAAEPMRIWRGNSMMVAAEEVDAPGENGFRAEAESFADAVRGAASWTGADEAFSMDIALTLDAIKRSVELGTTVVLPGEVR